MAIAASLAEARSHNVPPDVFLRHYRTIKSLKDDHADTGAAVARAKKAAKAAGIDMDALKLIEKIAALDADEAEMQIRHLQIYAGWLNLPIGSQLDMFGRPEPVTVDAAAAAEQAEWQAGDDGRKAGGAGHSRTTNPNDPGSAEFVAWDKAWAKSYAAWTKDQQRIAAEMAENAREADGDPPLPPAGRKRRNGGDAATAH